MESRNGQGQVQSDSLRGYYPIIAEKNEGQRDACILAVQYYGERMGRAAGIRRSASN